MFNPLHFWLTLTGNVLAGTPPAAGTINITVTATDQSGFTASETFLITSD